MKTIKKYLQWRTKIGSQSPYIHVVFGVLWLCAGVCGLLLEKKAAVPISLMITLLLGLESIATGIYIWRRKEG